jgi:uncharacterized membrane protein
MTPPAPSADVSPTRDGRGDMELLVGYILQAGVLLSVTLIIVGLGWHWILNGNLQAEYPLVGMNLFQFALMEMRQLASGAVRPRLLVALGITVLMLTPYIRVLVSMLYFALGERNLKYTLFTGFVFAVLTYSLFLR